MEFPFEFVLADVADLPHTERLRALLVRLQGEGGYPSDDASARVRELHAIAHLFAYAEAALDAALAGVHPQESAELIDAHDRRMRAPNDASRTIEERQARLVAIAAGRRCASGEDIVGALARLGVSATVHGVSRSEVVAEGGAPEGIFQIAVALDPADATPAARRAAYDLLRRATPVLQYGHRQHATPLEHIVTSVGPTWGDPDAVLGRCALDAATGATQTRAPSRRKPYGACSRLTARDLNALQEQMLVGACSHANNSLRHANAGSRAMAFAVHVAGGASVTVFSGDARYRLVRIAVRRGDDTTDRRPGQAGDLGLNASTSVDRLWFTGAGGAGYALDAANVRFWASNIGITVGNLTGSAFTVVGFLDVSGSVLVGAGDTTSRIVHFADGATLDATGLNAGWWTAMLDAVGVRRANGADAEAWSGFGASTCGGVARQIVLAHSIQPGTGATTFVVDTSIDWRRRLLFVQFAEAGQPVTDYVSWPGGPKDRVFSSYPTVCSAVGYTGIGVVPGSGSLASQHIALEGGLVLAARSTDGALILEHQAGIGDEQLSAVLIVHASDDLFAIAPIANPALAVDGEPIVGEQLNGLQDAGMLTQGRAIEPTEPHHVPVPVAAMPLGPAVRGQPRVPVSWVVSRRNGRRDAQAPFERRQPVAGRLRRVFAVEVPTAASVVIDDAHDWRDRMLVGWVAFSASDIRPEHAADADIASGAASQTRLATYTGSGRASGAASSGDYLLSVQGTDLVISARATDGALEARNDLGATRWLVGWIDAGFPLGPRSVAGPGSFDAGW